MADATRPGAFDRRRVGHGDNVRRVVARARVGVVGFAGDVREVHDIFLYLLG